MTQKAAAFPDFVAVVLAAGRGTRLRSQLAKVRHRAGGRPLVEHAVRACQALGPREIFVVVGHQAAAIEEIVTPLGAKTILQEPQLGTGHALQVARKSLEGGAKFVLVLPGDAPLIHTDTLASLARTHREGGAAATVLSAILENPAGYGRIVRKKDGSVGAIVEEKAADNVQRAIREINSSLYAFTLDKLWPCLEKLRPTNVHKELYLTDAIALLDQRGERVLAEVAADPFEVLGCNTRAELAEVDRIFRDRKRRALMDSGVTIYLPETVLVDPDVEVGEDTVIEPGVHLLGATRIGAGCTIRTGSVLTDAVLDDGVIVRQHCIISASRLGPGAVVGPFAHLRDGAELAARVKVGNFVEVKKSKLAEGVKAQHLAYLGDATIGRDTNIGAGTITCNYDGVRKNPTIIGERVFVGSNSALVAPLTVGDDAYIAAGSTITEDVPADALAIARGRQANKEGWAVARRADMTAKTAEPATTAASSARPMSSPRRKSRRKTPRLSKKSPR
jgi:bifunctional UDP-N-acetylglucosamine pyrophosphorylase/glucosamine-1-phosphate N-acetyltransferase